MFIARRSEQTVRGRRRLQGRVPNVWQMQDTANRLCCTKNQCVE